MNGDSWRWNVLSHYRPYVSTISVIEPPEEEQKKPKQAVRRAPFGFSRELEPDEAPSLSAQGFPG